MQTEENIAKKARLSPNEEDGLFFLIQLIGFAVLPFWMSSVVAALIGAIVACAFRYLIAPPLMSKRIKFTYVDFLMVVVTLAIALAVGYFRILGGT